MMLDSGAAQPRRCSITAGWTLTPPGASPTSSGRASATTTTRRWSHCGSGWSSCRQRGTAASTGARTCWRSAAPGPSAAWAGTRMATSSPGCAPTAWRMPSSSGCRRGRTGARRRARRASGGGPAQPGLLRPTRLTAADDRLRDLAADLTGSADTPLENAERICDLVHSAITYEYGVTSVRTTAAEALAGGRGVCQDSAHVMLALCHLAGLPARYVSGHLLGQGGTHAWVEVITARAQDAVAVAFDPCNGRRTGSGYVTVATGRDYATTLRLWRTFSMVTGLPRPGTRCSRPWQTPDALRRPGVRAAADGSGRAAVPGRPAGRVFTDRGVTYDFAGEERPFPLDLIPRVIDAVEWDLVARGCGSGCSRSRRSSPTSTGRAGLRGRRACRGG
jgi:hypothetical protein